MMVLIVGLIVVGGWVGVRMRRRGGEPTEPASEPQHRPPLRMRIMRAPPAEPPVKAQSLELRMPAAKAAVASSETSDSVKPPETKSLVSSAEAAPESSRAQSSQGKTEWSSEEVAEAKKLLWNGKEFEARAMLTRLILSAPEGAQREELKGILDSINKSLFFSKAPSPDSVFHTVRGGDTLSGIAKKEGKDVYFSQLIMRVNGIHDAKRIRAGQRLKIPRGKFSAQVQRRAHRLIILLNGHYIKEYLVGVGAPTSRTPLGEFVVANTKAINPPWTSMEDGRVYKFGDPKNILGTRWIGFVNTEEYQGLGIHGATEPETIGKDVSNGCIRMLNEDVEEVFGMLMPGDRVTVVP